MNLNDMILVSVDDHVVEPPSMSDFMRDHMPARFRDRVPRVVDRSDGSQAWLIEGQEVSTFGLNASAGRVPEEWGLAPNTYDRVRAGCFDVHQRIRDMNANGVLASLNFSSWPGISGQYFATHEADSDYVEAVTRAYNDWHVDEWCGAYPGRFIPLGLSGFMLGAEWMAGEIRRLADKGCHAVSQHSDTWRWGMPDLQGDEWDPAWQACQETATVMVYHFGGAPSVGPRANIDIVAHVMPAATAIFASELIWSPYMRKFPDVKIALAEAGIGWIPNWLERLDHVYTTNPWRWSANSFGDRLPSEIWNGRVLACFIEDRAGLRLRDLIGVENLAWECDYPHPDTTWPHSPENIMAQFVETGCSDEEINQITWENACRFYGHRPFAYSSREKSTVSALRALAVDVDTTPRSFAGT
jgi:predicted TIM-barrel fold metal-dependent hydrolase